MPGARSVVSTTIFLLLFNSGVESRFETGSLSPLLSAVSILGEQTIAPYPFQALIIATAQGELGRGPCDVGRELNRYPFALGGYLGPQEPWCSEFVSWTYMVSGYPLTHGGEGGWLFRSSLQLKEWFLNNARFLSPSDPYWDSAEPMPGDFIRYKNDHGGHSGMVRAVSGPDLLTVEGNVRNRVVYRTIRHWRDRPDIDGIGLRSVPPPGDPSWKQARDGSGRLESQ